MGLRKMKIYKIHLLVQIYVMKIVQIISPYIVDHIEYISYFQK